VVPPLALHVTRDAALSLARGGAAARWPRHATPLDTGAAATFTGSAAFMIMGAIERLSRAVVCDTEAL